MGTGKCILAILALFAVSFGGFLMGRGSCERECVKLNELTRVNVGEAMTLAVLGEKKLGECNAAITSCRDLLRAEKQRWLSLKPTWPVTIEESDPCTRENVGTRDDCWIVEGDSAPTAPPEGE